MSYCQPSPPHIAKGNCVTGGGGGSGGGGGGGGGGTVGGKNASSGHSFPLSEVIH